MKTESEHTRVIFRLHCGEILALFPAMAGAVNQPHTCCCYAHVGQHGSADYGACIARSRPATPAEYNPLKDELERIGYSVRVAKKQTAKDRAEIRAQLSIS